MVDYHLIMVLLPLVARMFFLDQIDIHLSAIQSVSTCFTGHLSQHGRLPSYHGPGTPGCQDVLPGSDIHLSAIKSLGNGSFTTLSLGGFVLKIPKTMEIVLKYEQCGFIEKLQCA